ncbi:MAG TPA: Xaa-Pro peptidase family protein [Baekduia sp.]
MTPPFEKDELRARGQRARALMERDGLDALLVTGDFSAGLNYYYLSGHMPRDYQLNFSRPHVMVLPREGDPFLFLYGVNAENARDASWVEDIVAYAPPFSGAELADALAARGLHRGRIGAELGFDQRLAMPVNELRALEDRLDGGALVDASALLWELRAIKTPAEVAYVREADRINGDGLALAFSRLSAGDTEVDAARAVGAALIESGAYRPPYAQLLLVSEAKSRGLGHASRMLGPLPEYALEPGQLLFVDSGVIVNGYWGEFNRMAVVGEPTAEQTRHHDNIRAVVSRSVDEALKPGVTFRAVIELMAGFYRDCGYTEEQFGNYLGPPFMHLCHGLGLQGSEPPFVRYDSEQVLEPGMVLSCEAYLRDDDMTYGSEEDIVITEDGCEVLSSRDPGLYVIEA